MERLAAPDGRRPAPTRVRRPAAVSKEPARVRRRVAEVAADRRAAARPAAGVAAAAGSPEPPRSRGLLGAHSAPRPRCWSATGPRRLRRRRARPSRPRPPRVAATAAAGAAAAAGIRRPSARRPTGSAASEVAALRVSAAASGVPAAVTAPAPGDVAPTSCGGRSRRPPDVDVEAHRARRIRRVRLQRLVLSGFKTFAHRTEIRFGAGITGVVGPNGSGKSNLVDAVRWALGETNARELRGSRLDEMIFAGGTGRDRMGVAEVELILDNEDGLLPVEDAEVALSRRVVRGGDVEYRINGERARLRDLERILGGTGLTQHGYAVVAQHDIEAIIEATPRQRRSLVEQAAGVRPLRVACDDALRRLDLVGTAVQRLVDRLGKSEPRLAQLAGEREAALEVRGMAERLASLRGSLRP